MSNDAGEKPIERTEEEFDLINPEENPVDEVEDVESEVEAPQEETESEVPNKENPDRFEFWQSKFTKEQQEREKLAQELEQYKGKFSEYEKTVSELQGRIPEPKKEELLPPQKPSDDDPVAKIEYLEKLTEYQAKKFDELNSSIQQERQMTQKEKEAQQYKSYMVGEYVKAGVDPQEAQKIFDTLSKPEAFDPKNQVAFYQTLMGQNEQPKPKKKIENSPPPPGVSPSEAEDTKKELDFGADLNDYYKKTKIY